MDPAENIRVESHRPRRRTAAAGALSLFAVLTSIAALPSASVAAEPISETTATAAATASPATAPPPSPATPAPAPAPEPAPPPPAESPVAVVDRSLDSAANAPVPPVVRERAHQAVEAVETVVDDSGVTHVPVVDDAAQQAGAAARSLAGGTAKVAGAGAASQHLSPAADDGDRLNAGGQAEPAPHKGFAGPPPPAPDPEIESFVWPASGGEIHLIGASHAPALSFAGADIRAASHVRGALDASASMLAGGSADEPPASSRNAPPPALPPGAATSSALGGAGFAFSILLLGLLAVFALAAPRAPIRRLAVGHRHRSALVVCALARPG